MNLEQKLSTRDIRDYAQIVIVGLFLCFSIYTNAKKVPILEESISSLNVRTSVLESRLNTVQASLDRIETAVTRHGR